MASSYQIKGVAGTRTWTMDAATRPLKLMTMADNLKFSKHKEQGKAAYDQYDNYDAIEVGTYKEIPSDYDGVMGVPITFLDKYNPDQFEILGTTESNDPDNAYRTRVYTSSRVPRRLSASDSASRAFTTCNASGVVNGVKVFKRVLIRRRTRPAKGTKK